MFFRAFSTLFCLFFSATAFAQEANVPIKDPASIESPKQIGSDNIPDHIKIILQETDQLLNEAIKPQDTKHPDNAAEISLPNKRAINKKATFMGINKITARNTAFDIKTGIIVKFGTLEILLHDCIKAPPEERPEAKALLEIWETTPYQRVFFGWMFASNPSLSALEHPIYDITIIDCRG